MSVPNNPLATVEILEARIAPAFASVIELSGLTGADGFKLSGVAADDYGAAWVNDAGDFNGDGFGDFIISALAADSPAFNSGAAYVVFGKAGNFAPNVELSGLNGLDGFKITGFAASEFAGTSVASAGDLNRDGFDDLIIGAPGFEGSPGACYVVFGRGGGFSPALNISTLNGTNGFKVSGAAADDRFGGSVSNAGDVNGDGFDDVIAGALGADPNGNLSGASYVIFGKASGFAASFNVSALNGTNGFKISGVSADDRSGWEVSGAGDVNGDGFDDVIIGADEADPNGIKTGAAYVVFGKAAAFPANLSLAALNGSNGFRLTGVGLYESCGGAVSAAGDVNRDGFDDVIIGAQLAAANGADSGASYVVFGKANGFAAALSLAALDGSNGFRLAGPGGSLSGESVSSAGDVNGDGFDDVIIGAIFAGPNGADSGASYVFLGKAGGFLANVNLGALNGSNGFRINGVAAGDYAGNSVSSAGDINGDGFADLIIGAYGADPHGNRSGAGYVVFGKGIEIRVSDAAVTEGEGATPTLHFTVTLSEAALNPVTVQLATLNETAFAGMDFAPLSSTTLTFAPGEVSKTVTIGLIEDTLFENEESFSLILSDPLGGVIRDNVGIGTISNDDLPPLISISNSSILEGGTGSNNLVFTLSLSAISGLPAAVSFSTLDGLAVAASDYTARSGTVAFAPGETEKTITIEILGDAAIEAHESFSVILSAPVNATILEGHGTASGLIVNDDTSISIGDAIAREGHSGTTAVSFLVTLAAVSGLPVAVSFNSADGSATAAVDYIGITPGSVTFAPGETSKFVTVEVLGDTIVESGLETFTMILSDPVNALLEKSTGTGTILDDDVTIVGRRKATFVDSDGDHVTIAVNKGTLQVEDFILFPSGLGSQLAVVDFSLDPEFAGANVSITGKTPRGGSGNGCADVGFINAAEVDLGSITIDGDLGRIVAGSDLDSRSGVQMLKAKSMGVAGLATQLGDGIASLESSIVGTMKKLQLGGSMIDTTLSVSGDIGLLLIKGSVLGSTIASDGRIGPIKITADLSGTETRSAIISARGTLAPKSNGQALAIAGISIGGSVDSALILAGYDRGGGAVNGDVRVGRVTVSGDWNASSLVAGATVGTNGFFGSDGTELNPQTMPVTARIAAIVIQGNVTGTQSASDSFGFIAQEIGRFSSGGVKLPLTRGSSNDLPGILVGNTQDTLIRELT